MSPTNQLRSIGRIANECQKPVRQVLKAAETAGIAPSLTLDQVAYFTDADSERLTEAVYAQKQSSYTRSASTKKAMV